MFQEPQTVKAPPTFEDLNERLKEYLLCPEKLPIHEWERSINHWPRETKIDLLLDADDEVEPDTTLKVVRDLLTGEIVGLEETGLDNDERDDSLSMSRAPLPPNYTTRGISTQIPFLPAGFEDELEKLLQPTTQQSNLNIDTETDEVGKFFGEDMLTAPPGLKEGVIFAEDGCTVLNKENNTPGQNTKTNENINLDTKMNLKKAISETTQLDSELDIWKDEDCTPKLKSKGVSELSRKKIESEFKLGDDLFENNINHLPVELPKIFETSEIPLLNITSSNAETGGTSTKWAEMINTSQLVYEFDKKVKTLAMQWPFELDTFQKQAILTLEEKHHLFVAAHTSAGKTVIAEYAIAMSQRNFTRTIYTSPTKALSNQKYRDFGVIFGDVGLLTGDLQINATASCLVMTTEILRSMLYRGSDVTRDLEFVIFDEVHYVNNAERGYVWEEVLILLPAHVTIVMLSATAPNTLEFADWVGRTKKKKVYVVSTLKRPVPLCHYLYRGSGYENHLFLVVDRNGDFQLKGYNDAVSASKTKPKDVKRLSNLKAEEQTMWISFVHYLKEIDKLPVVAFTLSRNRCNQNAENMLPLELTTAVEKDFIHIFFQKYLQRLKESDRGLPQILKLKRMLMNGIGVHHSGVLPFLKEIVELLFQSGHVKILFATETFAMGINMPARTVVFEEIVKYDGSQTRLLTPAEYVQMAGRAGRRSIDETGTVIILCKDDVPDLEDLKEVMVRVPQRLTSQFRLTYAMILSLLRTTSISVEGMMQRSYHEIIRYFHIDKYKKQLELAEKEYSEKCDTPLPLHLFSLTTYYDTATAYIEALNEIMPFALDQPTIAKQIVPGRVMVVTVGPHINQFAIFLNKTVSRRTPYKVLLLNTTKLDEDAKKYGFETDDQWYRILSLYAYMGTEETTLDHIILCVEPKNIVAITKIIMEINVNVIIQHCEKQQVHRFQGTSVGSACLATAQELSLLSHAVRMGTIRIDYINLSQSLTVREGKIRNNYEKIHRLQKELASMEKIVNTANFKSRFAIVYWRKLAEKKRDKYKQLLSSEDLNLYSDYQNRLMVLRELKYIDKKDSILLKGRVACTMGSRNELILCELLFRNVFADKTSAEIVGLLSCFVFQAKTRVPLVLTEKLREGMETIKQIDAELLTIGNKYKVREFELESGRLNFGLVRVVYEWALEKPFAEIMDHTDVQEGIIVRCIQQLHEVLVNIKDAAVTIGDPTLQAKMLAASTSIRRDIAFVASLYIS